MVLACFTALTCISMRYKFLEGPLTSESQVNHLKVYQKYASPVVHFTDYTLPHTKAFFLNAHLSYYTALEAKNSIERTCAINSVTMVNN